MRNAEVSYDKNNRITIRKNSNMKLKIIRSKKSFEMSKRVTRSRIQKDFELVTLQTL